ncbi:MAG: hypothetical protein Q7S22_00610 [Candidatus Micrarchaeota archaeon]|nr:hypothetical protein [Candidatus Micrarchaeota archaeon]
MVQKLKIQYSKHKTSFGQVSAEFLILVAVAFLIISVMIILSQNQFADINRTRVQSIAKNTVGILGSTANEVYSQGEGARKLVYVEIPPGYDSVNSYVSNQTIRLYVNGQDSVYLPSFNVHGTLPGSSGNYWIWVISEGNQVRIGSAMIELSKSASNIVMTSNATAIDSVSVKNIFGSSVNVSVTKDWPFTNVILDLSSSSFTLPDTQSQPVTLTIQSDSSAVGIYNGKLTFDAVSGNTTESISFPITIEVLLPPGSNNAPPLTITPSTWNQTSLANETSQKAFQVCTNSATSLTSVTFLVTSGAAGSWVGNLAPLPAMGPDSCQTKVFNMSIPLGTIPGQYTGTITATGVGVLDAQDTVALQITVGGNITDNQGPTALNLNKIPLRPFLGDPVTITATCDDTLKGNSSVKSAEISLDGGGWTILNPSDGSYNAPVENVSYTYYTIGFGAHNATLRCIDFFDNVGAQGVYQFKVMKEILFVTKDSGVGGSEQEWVDWLNTHSSNESYNWNKDIYHRNVVIDSSFDITRYAVVIFAEDVTQGSTGSQLVTKLISFTSEGGNVLIFDKAVQNTAQPLGLGWGFEYFAQNSIYIVNNQHYITQSNSLGTKVIYTSNSKVYYIFPYSGTSLAIPVFWFPTSWAAIGEYQRFIHWGVSKPYRFNVAGNSLTVRIVDYAIMSSTVD